ncbi:MAG: PhoH family protein [Sphingomonadales bacterium]
MKTRTRKTPEKTRLILEFEDNALLPSLFGQHDQHLARLEQGLGVQVASRGNRIVLKGEDGACRQARKVLRQLYANLEKGEPLTLGDVDGALRLSGEPTITMTKSRKEKNNQSNHPVGEIIKIATRKRIITPRTPAQNHYLKELLSADLIFAAGPAGTGKTYLGVAMAVAELIKGSVDRIILSRPAVEAGESLGYLPGDMKEKVDPYLRPLYDALHDTMPAEQVAKCIEIGEIEIAPVAFMRGRTLSHSYVILDEAQNSTPGQMKMFLTRLGENSRMVVTGDPSQVDLLPGVDSGLDHAMGVLEGVEGVSVVRFTEKDVIRNPLVRRIINAYDAPEKTKGAKK